jgi:serine/threonine protein kinase
LLTNHNNLSQIKLADFGLSQKMEGILHKQCGTLQYMAPELIRKHSYGSAIDLWSIGIIMYKMIKLGKHPYLHNC